VLGFKQWNFYWRIDVNKFLLLCMAGILSTVGFTASNAEPLRKCSFYEIMNDEDEDGLVQNPKDGPSVCQYTQQDLAAAKKNPLDRAATAEIGAVSELTAPPEAEAAIPVSKSKRIELNN
jgi:hypothetical protein